MEYKDRLADWDNGDVEPLGQLMFSELAHVQAIYQDHLADKTS